MPTIQKVSFCQISADSPTRPCRHLRCGSSWPYRKLQRLGLDIIKVDRSITAALDRRKQGEGFFRAIFSMAHSLGLRVVAEGMKAVLVAVR